MYVSNTQNYDLYELSFDSDEMLITILWIYCINDVIVESLNNGLIVNMYINWI